MQGLLGGFAGDADVFSPTNAGFTFYHNTHLKLFFTKGVMSCKHYPLKSESNKQDYK